MPDQLSIYTCKMKPYVPMYTHNSIKTFSAIDKEDNIYVYCYSIICIVHYRRRYIKCLWNSFITTSYNFSFSNNKKMGISLRLISLYSHHWNHEHIYVWMFGKRSSITLYIAISLKFYFAYLYRASTYKVTTLIRCIEGRGMLAYTHFHFAVTEPNT